MVRLRVLLHPPSSPAYPGAWDLQRDAFFSGLAGSGWAIGRAVVIQHAVETGPASLLREGRASIAARFLAGLPGAEGAIAATLFTGTQTAIPPDDRAAFRDSGLAHLLAVAGLHIGIVMAVVFGAVRRLLALSEQTALRWPCKQIAGLASLFAGAFYALLTGAHVPILRSLAMAALVVTGLLVGRRPISLRGLAIAAVALLIWTPEEAVGVSFGMSFAAVLALISGYEALHPVLARLRGPGGWRRRLALHAVQLALTSLLAGTASIPFAAFHFGHVQLYFVLANLLAVPVTATLVMPAGLVAILLMPVHAEALALWPMGKGISLLLGIAHAVSGWPHAIVAVPHGPGWSLVLAAFGLAWLGLWRTGWRICGVVPLAVGVAAPFVLNQPDALVSANGRLIGLRTHAGLLVQDRGGNDFTLASWRATWASGTIAPLLPGRFGPDAATGWLADQAPVDCQGLAVVLSAEPLRDTCPGVPHVDRFSVWRDGAAAIWLRPGGAVITTDRAWRGSRPWVPPVPTRRATPPGRGLPMAPTE